MDPKEIKASYGVDAPLGILQLVVQGTLYVVFAWPLYWWIAHYTHLWALVAFWTLILGGLGSLLLAFLMVLSSIAGKPKEISDLVSQLDLNGHEQVLDVGCGTGMLLVEVAKKVPHGHVFGLDIWQTRDQQPNSYVTTLMNANREGVEQRIDLKTGDMREIPFSDNFFDVVVSSLAIHNVSAEIGRQKVLNEIVRVLKPDGRFALLDFQYTDQYEKVLEGLSCKDVLRSDLHFRMFPPVRIVTGRK